MLSSALEASNWESMVYRFKAEKGLARMQSEALERDLKVAEVLWPFGERREGLGERLPL